MKMWFGVPNLPNLFKPFALIEEGTFTAHYNFQTG
jgi:hypothetical protein